MPVYSKKKVLLSANTDWYLYNFRRHFIQMLIARGYEVILVTPPGEYVEKLVSLGCTHIPWQVSRRSLNPFRELASLQKLRNIYTEVAPDLIHQHTLKSVVYGNFAAGRRQVPIINSIAGRGYIYSSASLLATLLRPFLDLALRISMRHTPQQVIFENQIDMQYFLNKQFITPQQANLIESVGVDTNTFKPSPLPDMQTFTVGYVGRMLWDKGVGVFVQAAQLLKESAPQIRMVLIGMPDPGNPKSISTEQMETWDAQKVVEWWKWQSDMPQTYGKLHALAFPTNYGEGVPTVLLEAAACERALIASDSPGCREVIDHGVDGLLVPAEDHQGLAEQIRYLSEHEDEYHRIRKNAYQKVHQSFTSEYITQRTLKVYDYLLK